MKINSNSHTSKSQSKKMPDDHSNMGPDGPNREVTPDGLWNFGRGDGVDIGGSRCGSDSSYFGCGDSGDGGGGAFLG